MRKQFLATVATIALMAGSAQAASMSTQAEATANAGASVDADVSMTKPAGEENRTSPSLKTTGETSAEAVVDSAVDGTKKAVDAVVDGTRTAVDAAADGTEALVSAAVDAVTVQEKIEGATVYGANGEASGEVDRVIANADGNIEAYVVDVGGFLGIGEKPVAISSANIDIRTDADGDLSVYTPFTKEQLEAQPEYTEMAYKSAPESVIMTAPSTQ